MVPKKRLIVSYKNCEPKVLQAIKEKYPLGYGDAVIKIDKPNGDFFHAITVDLEEISYLVKVDVKIDNLSVEDFDKHYGAGEESEDDFEAKENVDPDNIASTDSNFDE